MENNIDSNALSASFLNEVVDTIDSFLHRGAKKRFKSIQDAAASMKSVWEKLEFPIEDPVCAEWQKSGIEALNKIIRGELTGFDAEDHLHGVNGMFNQTFRSAVNVA